MNITYHTVLCVLTTLALVLQVSAQDIPEFRKKEGTRQIHLDFHTSEALKNIGEKFDKKQFQKALKAGNVNSINVFAKGHHGWSYYPTEVGKQHPHLGFDLLGEQIKACHEIGVRVQAYYTIGWSVRDAEKHPEWVFLDEKGKDGYTQARSEAKPTDPMPWGWPMLFPEGPYLDLILRQTEELVKKYDLDGVWYDIIPLSTPNYNAYSKKDMHANGIDPDDTKAANDWHIMKTKRFLEETRKMVQKHRPHASVFYNWTTHLPFRNTFENRLYEYNTKIDLEDLPTAWAGYDIFPYRAKYFANEGKPIVAMSGKFHKSWGEFGGFKHRDAIRYEAAAMVAFGAAVNFGDQLHPSGLMEMATYENIGYAYDYVEKIEDYGVGADHEAAVGFWFTQNDSNDQGTVRMLLENQINFVVANNLKDGSQLQAIVIPGQVKLSDEEVKRLQAFQSTGGKLLVMAQGAFDPQRQAFQLDLGVQYLGDARYDIDYLHVEDPASPDLVNSPFLNYQSGIRVRPEDNARIMATIREPYFSRTWEHFSSHANTPYQLVKAEHPGVVKSGNTIYIAHELDKMYFEHGARVHRELFMEALSALKVEPIVKVDMPSLGRINLLHQPDRKRYVLHLLYAAPIQRGSVSVIEDLVPLYNVPVEFDPRKKVEKIYTIPDMKFLDFNDDGQKIRLTIPEFTGHTAVVFEYN